MRELNCFSLSSNLGGNRHLASSTSTQASTIESIHQAATALRQGFLVAFPTETVYGLGADGLNPKAVSRIFDVKGRPKGHPLILHAPDRQTALSVSSNWSPMALGLAEAFWPGPLTLILKKSDLVPLEVTGGQDSVGIRVPDQPIAHQMLMAFAEVGSGLVAAPSANRFGGVSPTRASDVVKGLGPFLMAEDCVLKSEDCAVGLESSIVDCRNAVPRLLRPGGLSRDRLNEWLVANGFPVLENSPDTPNHENNTARQPALRVSGSLDSHYAPRCPLILVGREDFQGLFQSEEALSALGLLKFLEQHPGKETVATIGCLLMEPWAMPLPQPSSLAIGQPNGFRFDCRVLPADPASFARQFYQLLNDWDDMDATLILVEKPPQSPAWEALWDRLRRAATRN